MAKEKNLGGCYICGEPFKSTGDMNIFRENPMSVGISGMICNDCKDWVDEERKKNPYQIIGGNPSG